MKQQGAKGIARKIARDIKLLILDVDGVLTDGSIILDNGDNEYKAFHVRDGHGIRMLHPCRHPGRDHNRQVFEGRRTTGVMNSASLTYFRNA